MEMPEGSWTLRGEHLCLTYATALLLISFRRPLRRAVETVYVPNGISRVVKMPEITSVIKAMQNSPTAAYLKDCSFVERIILAALMKCVKREGVNEIKWADVSNVLPLQPSSIRSP